MSAPELTDERNEFEAWMQSLEGYPFARQFANLMWNAWQERARRTADIDEAKGEIEQLDIENHRMRRCVAKLMARLTVWLDDDQFNEADGIMTPEFEPPATSSAAAPVARPSPLAMRVMQSDLYRQLDDAQRAECDGLLASHREWLRAGMPDVPAIAAATEGGEG